VSIDRSRVPEPGAAPVPEIPRPHRLRLENGLHVASVRRDRLPEATLSLVLPAASFITGVALPIDGGLTIRNA